MLGASILGWIAFLVSVFLFEMTNSKRLAVIKQRQNMVQKFGKKERVLPSDMVHEIMELLTNEDLLNFSQASKSCHSYAEKLWKQRLDGVISQSYSYFDSMDGLSPKLHYFLVLPRSAEFTSKLTSSVDLLASKTTGLPWFQLWKSQTIWRDPFLPFKFIHAALFAPTWFDRFYVAHRGHLLNSVDFKSVQRSKHAIIGALLILHLPLFQMMLNLMSYGQEGETFSIWNAFSDSWSPTHPWSYKDQFLICFMLFVFSFFEARLRLWHLVPLKIVVACLALVLSEGIEKLLAVGCTVGLAWLIVWFLNFWMLKSAGFKSDSKPLFWFFVLCAYYPMFSLFSALWFVVSSAVSLIPPRYLLIAGMLAETTVLLSIW